MTCRQSRAVIRSGLGRNQGARLTSDVDESKKRYTNYRYSALTVLHQFDGVVVRRVVDASRSVVAEHAHDWPLLSLFVMGAYTNVTGRGAKDIDGPSAVFYRPGTVHKNIVGALGFEQIEIEFDPAWLGSTRLPASTVQIGGAFGAAAQFLAKACTESLDASSLRSFLRRLLDSTRISQARPSPAWVEDINRALRVNPARSIASLAVELGRSAAWIGPAYRHCTGESLQNAAARFRVERAALLLRESSRRYADIAADAGFCDQSHMNRLFRRLFGRTPTEVRSDHAQFRTRILNIRDPLD